MLLGILRLYYVRENNRRDKLLAEGQDQTNPSDEFADKTDLELPGFRYVVSGPFLHLDDTVLTATASFDFLHTGVLVAPVLCKQGYIFSGRKDQEVDRVTTSIIFLCPALIVLVRVASLQSTNVLSFHWIMNVSNVMLGCINRILLEDANIC